ncbi:hypothetical protein D3C71_2186310 [compost metagenome]
MEFDVVEGERGGRPEIHDSKVSRSGATPCEATSVAGSAEGIFSITVSRVSIVVPCRA